MATIIEMPKLSDTMTVGTLVKWLKKEGDRVSNGDILAEVETDKATMELESFEDGTLLKLYVDEGAETPIGAGLCAIGEPGEEAPPAPEGETAAAEAEPEEAANGDDGGDTPEAEESTAEPEPETSADDEPEPAGGKPTAPPPADEESGKRIKASPLARKIARDRGISLSAIEGSGPGGRIVKADVEAAAEKGPSPADGSRESDSASPKTPSPAPAGPVLGEDADIKVSNMRASIARALVSSKTTAPHFYLQIEMDAAPLAALRKSLNAQLADLPPEQGGAKFTINDLVLKAAAEAVRRVPAINRSWQEKTIRQHGSVHLAFGVAVDDGLVTPVIRNAERKALRQIAGEARALIAKARDRKLKPDEMTGSTLTVTNLGMYGISDFYGIINPPNAAILSVGAAVTTPVVAEDGSITVGSRMKVGLSGDHRVIDGAVGALYLQQIKAILESPATMLV